MKTSQLVLALAALMVLVFAITFAMNYLQQTPPKMPDEGAEPELPVLAFDTMHYPPVKHSIQEWEHKQPGHADFWFVNPHLQPIRIGMKSKSCTCSHVELFLPPPDWGTWRDTNRQVSLLRPLAGMGISAYLHREKGRADKATDVAKFTFRDKDDAGYLIGPNIRGWLRLHWNGDALNQQRYNTTIWSHHHLTGATQVFEVNVAFFQPIMLPTPVVSLGKMLPNDLPKEVKILCVSPTRYDLTITAEKFAASAVDAKLYEVGAPVKLSRADTEALMVKHKSGPILSAYEVPVRLLNRIDDRLFDVGPFRKLVRLTVADVKDPVIVPVTGTIESDVQVGGREDNGRINLGTFPRSGGRTSQPISLSSDVPEMKLELDRSRVPEYLNVTFTDEGPQAGGRRLWKLVVAVPPDSRLNGVFPRDDAVAYQDSAIYVKATSPLSSRLLRIPVEGNADSR